MSTRYEIQLMIQVARLYHEKGLTQEEIAQRLNITRQKVSRLLIAAKSQGIVKVVVVDPLSGDSELEVELKERFHLNEVILTPGENLENNQLRAGIGLAAAEYLKQRLQPNQNVGIGWGRTLFETVNMIRDSEVKPINVIPLIGGVGDISPFFQVNELARRLADGFGGTYRHLYAPAFIEDNTLLEKLIDSPEVVQIALWWDRLDAAIVGVGHIEFQQISSMFFGHHINPDTLAFLKSKGAVGDLCARFFDIHGEQVFTDMGVIGINLDQLKTIPEVIAIAGGVEKVRALLGALRGGYIKTLITDTLAARAVLEESKRR